MSSSFLKSIKSFVTKRRLVRFRKRIGRALKVEDLTEIAKPINEDIVLEEDQEADSEEKRSHFANSLKDYDLIQVLGSGGYAKVVLAQLKNTKELYALKVLKKTFIIENDNLDSVRAEKRVYETAWKHPYLVNLHSCFQTTSRIFFAMDFIQGGDFISLMSRYERLPEQQTIFYAAEIGLALNFLHNNGIIYRDLKLDNVLLDHEGHIKLTDYGLCKDGMREGDKTMSFCGTPNYLAPETIMGKGYNFSVDWWALGVIVFEMLCGRSPFANAYTGDSGSQMNERILGEIVNGTVWIPRTLSLGATSFIKELLCKEATERLGSRVDNSEAAFHDVMRHPFFTDINWELLKKRQLRPPYVPQLSSDTDLSYFPTECTEKTVQFTPDQTQDIVNIKQEQFEGFECLNYDLLTE